MKSSLTLLIAGMVVIALGGIVSATHVSCGDTITEDTTLDSDLLNCPGHGLNIGANDITLDCQGHTIRSNVAVSGHHGIRSDSKQNITIKNCIVQNFGTGIFFDTTTQSRLVNNNLADNKDNGFWLLGSSNNILTDNTADNNEHGFLLTSSPNNILTDNTANNNNRGFFLNVNSNSNTLTNNAANNNSNGFRLRLSKFNTLTSNTANNNGNGFVLPSSNYPNTLISNTANNNTNNGFLLQSSSSNTLTNNIADNNNVGFRLSSSSNSNTLISNTAQNNIDNGFYLLSSSSNTLTNNIADNNNVGFLLQSSSNNILTSNTANNNQIYGFIFSSSNFNTFTNNIAQNSNVGFLLVSSSNNILTNSTIISNNLGMSISISNTNLIYNNFFNNTLNAQDNGNNFWNITKTAGTNIIGGPFLGGNFWHDYLGIDVDSDGIGDTELPYNSNGNIAIGGDFLPLVPSLCGSTIIQDTTLTSDLICSGTALTIGANDITLDCDGHTITGSGVDSGILAQSRQNITIKNCVVQSFANGIRLESTIDSQLINNTVNNNTYGGIYLYLSNSNSINNNQVNDNAYVGIYVFYISSFNTIANNTANNNGNYGISVFYFSDSNTLTSNTANNNNYGIQLSDSNSNTLTSNTAQNGNAGFSLSSSSNSNTLTSNTANNNNKGFSLQLSSNNILTNNIANNNNQYGFYLSQSSNNILTDNTANNNPNGFALFASSNNILTDSTAQNSNIGFYLSGSPSNTLTDNTVNNNLNGFWLFSSSNNILTSNTVKDNSVSGINTFSSNNNLIFNNFFNNTNNAQGTGQNFWNITKTAGANIIGGPYLGGNFWSDYIGEDLDGDGLGDTLLPYNSSGNIANGGDFLPLVFPSPIDFDFNLTVSPSNQTTRPGGNAIFMVDVILLSGISQNVNLTVTVVNENNATEPSITSSLFPSTVLPTSMATLFLGTNSSTPNGNYKAIVTGTSGTIQKTANVTLIVSGPPLNNNPIALSDFTVKLVTGTPGANETKVPSTGSFIIVLVNGSSFSVIDNDATDGVGIIQLINGNYKFYGILGGGGNPPPNMTLLSPFISGFVSPQSITLPKTGPPTIVDITSLTPFFLKIPAPASIVDSANVNKPWVSQFYPSPGLPYNLTNNNAQNTKLIFISQ